MTRVYSKLEWARLICAASLLLGVALSVGGIASNVQILLGWFVVFHFSAEWLSGRWRLWKLKPTALYGAVRAGFLVMPAQATELSVMAKVFAVLACLLFLGDKIT